MIRYLAPRGDRSLIDHFLEDLGAEIADVSEVIFFEEIESRSTFDSGLYVIVGLERLGPGAKALIEEVYDQLHGKAGFRFLNHPRRTLGRFELLRLLQEQGLNDYAVYGAWEDLAELRFPAFVRDRSKDGGAPRLLHSRYQVDRAIGRALVDGRDLEQLLVIEFLDTADADRKYRKYSVFRIAEKLIPVSIDYGSRWVLRRHSAEYTREILEEEFRYVSENPHEEALDDIFRLAGTDYGRIDYSMLNGRVQTWEINDLPMLELPANSAPVPDELAPLREATLEVGYATLPSVLRRTAMAVGPGTPIHLSLSESVIRSARREFSRETPLTYPGPERLSTLRGLFRPLKKVLFPLFAAVVLPLLAKVKRASARRRSRGGRDG